ncbi:hypothetical protein SCLCIDRAFT_34507 [Scleroderma citrinum Foug A]|uniref:Uncharacterized protein n=1 Tax=Scleroderma citrinum Foug A TaxID=1036808 RepID=A0A0C3D299_9AGAM|nr:hypothetical protein SCLCIDRAFT_34507 [Scleroderma citrinum Foug A]
MLVVDLMHEFELGIWKALFTHLIRILNAAEVGDILVNELDRHYRMVPTFGGDTIRKFASNTSEMKRMAARDFEDVLQMAGIERCEAWIRHIRNLNNPSPLGTNVEEGVATTLDAHFHIGKSQNFLENIMMFLCKHSEDPAVKNGLHPEDNLELVSGTIPRPLEEQVYIAADHFYKHNLMCLNYTTYDVRRAQDIVNPSTSHCNIMLLADHADGMDGLSQHLYIYTHVLGIFHVNATYIGPGMIDYCPRHIDFLWVHWYQYAEEDAGWDALTLDRVSFPPMADEHAFSFIDPDYVLQACHIIPQFSRGLRHLDGTGISRCAQDASDWHFYYVNRFVDRDMVMQYHWGLGVGHAYAHGQGIGNETVQNQTSKRDGHDTVENDWNEDVHDSFPELSDNGKDEEASDWDIDNDLHGGSEFGSGSSDSSSDDDFEDYDALDYQN